MRIIKAKHLSRTIRALPFLTATLAGAMALQANAARLDVYSGPDLQQAIQAAKAGDEIVLHPGGYESVATGSLSGFSNAHYYGSANGNASNPITLRSYSPDHKQVLTGTTVSKKIGLYITGDYWIIKDIVVTNSAKGIVLDNSNHSVIDNVVVHGIGQEAIHLRDNSSYNVVKNSTVYNTGLTSPGIGEAFYVGSHPGSDNGKGYEYGLSCNYNVIGGNTTGPGVTAEHIDIKEGTVGTVFEFNTMNGEGISGSNSADSFVDIKGERAVIRGNIANRNYESKVKHAFETHSDADENVFIGNKVDLNGSDNYLLFASVGVNHVSNDNERVDGRSDRIWGHWSKASVDSNIPSWVPAPGTYSSTSGSSSSSTSGSTSGSTSSSSGGSTSSSGGSTSSSGGTSTSSSSGGTSTSSSSSGGTGECSSYIDVSWNQRTEITLSNGSCIRFDRSLAGETVQFWDSDENNSCDFRGTVTSVEGSGSKTITGNYASSNAFTGKQLKLTNASGNSCKYIKVRAY